MSENQGPVEASSSDGPSLAPLSLEPPQDNVPPVESTPPRNTTPPAANYFQPAFVQHGIPAHAIDVTESHGTFTLRNFNDPDMLEEETYIFPPRSRSVMIHFSDTGTTHQVQLPDMTVADLKSVLDDGVVRHGREMVLRLWCWTWPMERRHSFSPRKRRSENPRWVDRGDVRGDSKLIHTFLLGSTARDAWSGEPNVYVIAVHQ